MSEADKIIESLKNSGKKVEEFYVSNKTSDKNVGSIEDDVKRCNELIKVEHANWIGISNQLAISHILAEREQLLKERDVANDSVIAHKFAVMQQQIEQKDKRIQELEEKNKHLSNVSDYETISLECVHLEEQLEIANSRIQELEEERNHWHGCFIVVMENSIAKEKVKDKIEELDIAILECKYDDDVEEYKNDVEKEKRILLIKKSALEELLEEK